jgi:hypothetical protein
MDKNLKLVRTLSTLIIAVAFLIVPVFLTSCADSERKPDSSLETTAVDSKDTDAEDSKLKEEAVSSAEEESSVDKEEVTESKIEEVSEKDEKATSSNSEKKEDSKEEYKGKVTVKTKEVQKEDSTAEYYVYGYDDSGKKIWTSKWSDLPLTELAVASDFTIHNNRVLIEVGGELYSMDIYTGKRLWKVGNVGASSHAPVVDSKNGAIYVTGYYGPFITAVTQAGKLKWQRDFEDGDLYWPYAVTVKAEGIIVKAEGTVSTFDRDGKLLEKKVLAEGEDDEADSTGAEYSINASSYLTEKSIVHEPYRIYDGDKNTAWVEGKADDGIGEYVLIDFRDKKAVSTINIINGYAKQERLYYSNNRVKTIRIEFENGEGFEYSLKDKNMGYQTIKLKEEINTNFIKLIIKDVYRGNKYRDTCISEVNIN